MSDPLSTTFAALADPTRRAILARLAEGDATVSELARPFDMSLPNVSKHLRALTEVGLVRARAEGRRRVYTLRPEPLRELDVWLAPYRRFWADRLDDLEAHLDRIHDEDHKREQGR